MDKYDSSKSIIVGSHIANSDKFSILYKSVYSKIDYLINFLSHNLLIETKYSVSKGLCIINLYENTDNNKIIDKLDSNFTDYIKINEDELLKKLSKEQLNEAAEGFTQIFSIDTENKIIRITLDSISNNQLLNVISNFMQNQSIRDSVEFYR